MHDRTAVLGLPTFFHGSTFVSTKSIGIGLRGEVSRKQDCRRRIGARSREIACLDRCCTPPIAASLLDTQKSMQPNNFRMLDSRKPGLI